MNIFRLRFRVRVKARFWIDFGFKNVPPKIVQSPNDPPPILPPPFGPRSSTLLAGLRLAPGTVTAAAKVTSSACRPPMVGGTPHLASVGS